MSMPPSSWVKGVPYGCPLSPREFTVMEGLAASCRHSQIADSLGVRESTVRSLAHQAYRRLDVADRAQAVIKCWQNGWVLIAGLAPAKMGDTPPDPEVTPETRAYLVAFMRWIKEPTAENYLKRRQALAGMLDVPQVTRNETDDRSKKWGQEALKRVNP